MNQLDLLTINVNEHTEKKNGLTYLSWAWAWAEALKADPAATFEVQTFDGMPYMRINDTGMVWVKVTMFGKPLACFLPIMNHRNQPIQEPDSFQVNTSIMRCLTKGLALHGLGLYIYAGEDLPEGEEEIVKVALPSRSVATTEPPKQDAQADLNADLFAKGMIEFTDLCENVKDLNSYWKVNQGQLDALKVSHPDLYGQIRNRFAEMKQQFSEKAA
tara:strand:- start:2488 stop:3135 length:648 start_codon:yes stop_codon:yes gene_type:complete